MTMPAMKSVFVTMLQPNSKSLNFKYLQKGQKSAVNNSLGRVFYLTA
jgi:hypothetical protein